MRKLYLCIMIILLQLCAACAEPVKYTQTWTPAPAPSEVKWTVRTDYSGLTPYVSLRTRYTRLTDGPLEELVASDGYGLLLPYASAAVTDSGYLQASMYGLVTAGGMVVTDLVYSSVARAYNSVTYNRPPLPAYTLSVNLPSGSGNAWFPERRHAVCALDGSWVTPLEYESVVYTEEFILLVRDFSEFDVDIYDYSGELIYNMLDLDLASKLGEEAWPGDFIYSASEGYMRGRLGDGRIVFIELATGAFTNTSYSNAERFHEGFAAVQSYSRSANQNLWGFIDKNFKLVIQPKYVYPPSSFMGGYAVAETLDGVQHVIDTRGETVISVDDGNISQNYDGSGFTIYDKEWNVTGLYSEDLSEYIPATRPGTQGYTQSIGGGWYAHQLDGAMGTYLFSSDVEFFFRGYSAISQVAGDYVVYHMYNGGESKMGVSTLDGREIVPAEENTIITAITLDSGDILFAVTSNSLFFMRERADYHPGTYKVVTAAGETLAAGNGTLSFDEATGLFSILAEDTFTYLGSNCSMILCIPMMSYSLD